MALSRSQYLDLALLVKDTVAIVTSVTPQGAATRTAYAIFKRTPQGEAIIQGLTDRGMDAFGVIQAIHEEFQSEKPLNELTDLMRIGKPLTRFPPSFDVRLPVKVPKRLKRKVNKFSQAIKKGMSIVKSSTSYGKKGTINNARKAFTLVTKTASQVNKTGKVASKGIKRKIGLAIKGLLK
jgi:hypothetical protein